MECRFKTSNHSNEQAKRISIEASGEEKIKRTEKGDVLKRKRRLKKRGTEIGFLSYSTASLKMRMITAARMRLRFSLREKLPSGLMKIYKKFSLAQMERVELILVAVTSKTQMYLCRVYK